MSVTVCHLLGSFATGYFKYSDVTMALFILPWTVTLNKTLPGSVITSHTPMVYTLLIPYLPLTFLISCDSCLTGAGVIFQDNYYHTKYTPFILSPNMSICHQEAFNCVVNIKVWASLLDNSTITLTALQINDHHHGFVICPWQRSIPAHLCSAYVASGGLLQHPHPLLP